MTARFISWTLCVALLGSCAAPARPDGEVGSATPTASPSPPSSSPPSQQPQVVFANGAAVAVELAITPETRRRGLMYRRTLAEDRGMLFLFHHRDVQTFWMRNTHIPLDMIFIDGPPERAAYEVVGLVADAEPESDTPRSAGGPCRIVLEVPGGWAARHGVAVGAILRLVDVPSADP